jgi:hypothetical protein
MGHLEGFKNKCQMIAVDLLPCWRIIIASLYNLEQHRYNNFLRSPPVRELQVWHPTFLRAPTAVVVPTTHRLRDDNHSGQAQSCSRFMIMPSRKVTRASQCSSSSQQNAQEWSSLPFQRDTDSELTSTLYHNTRETFVHKTLQSLGFQSSSEERIYV